jgi:hypothetical protein
LTLLAFIMHLTLLARPLAGAILAAAVLTACGGGSSSGGATTPTPPATTLTLSGASDRAITGGAPVALTAAASDSSALTWALAAGSPGSLSATSGASVNYLPPASGVSADTQVTINVSANGISKSIVLTLRPADYPRLEFVAGDTSASARIDGAGAQAHFTSILGGATDASGNLYIAEDAPAIRKVTPAGVVSTLFASSAGYVDGAKGTARIGQPLCPVTMGNDGGVYFVEGQPGVQDPDATTVERPIRKLASDGSVSTIAKITTSVNDRLCLAADGGKLYAYQYQRISTVSANGTVTTLAGAISDNLPSPVDGQGAAARFFNILQVVADGSGNLYVNDDGHVIRKVGADGGTSTLAGAYPTGLPGTPVALVDGAGASARFNQLQSLIYTGDGKLVAYDYYQSGPVTDTRLRTITTTGATSSVQAPITRRLLAGPGQLIYTLSGGVGMLKADGGVTPLAGDAQDAATGEIDGTGAAAHFYDGFNGMTSDRAGNIYVSDVRFPGLHFPTSGLGLRKITPAGVVTTIHHSAKVFILQGMQTDAAGNIYVATADSYALTGGMTGGMIYKIAPDGTTTVLAGAMPSTGIQDGVGAAAHFVSPYLVGQDAAGNLYVDDRDTNGVSHPRMVTLDGKVTSISALPAGLGQVKDAAGNTYGIDQGTVVRTTPAGVTSIVAGTPGESYNLAGDLPGHLRAPGYLVQTGPYTLAVTSGGAVMRIVLPH